MHKYSRNRHFRKVIAFFYIVIFAISNFYPSVVYALTNGPTAPESSSFEPIDTTDMVNTQTGDFTYNVPLLEVPGPEGGYPLSLSYHAAIEPNLDAGWVGLGWTVNPGSIMRSVNGYPDDWRDVKQVSRDYWNGGRQFTFGVDVGLAFGPVGVTAGATFGHDTYQGFGMGVNALAGVKFAGLKAGGTIAVDPWGNPSASIGISGASLANVRLGVSTDFNSITYTAGANFGIMDYSISSNNGNVQKSITGSLGFASTSLYNSNAGKIKTKDFALSFTCYIGISFSYMRYWSDESITTNTYGTIYDDVAGGVATDFDNMSFDSYSLLDHPFTNMVDNPDAYSQAGGVYPDVDYYSVTGQGIGGNIRPYHFQRYIYGQNRKDNGGNYKIRYYRKNPGYTNMYTSYRFINDFSNSYQQNLTDWNLTNLSSTPFDPSPIKGQNDGFNGYNSTNNQLAGSKHIQYFNNIDIFSGNAKANGFITTNSLGLVRPDINNTSLDRFKYQIGGFSITNESGVTYHYALPVYSRNEKTYSEKINTGLGDGNGNNWNTLTKSADYAYTWYLTSITGPDFVDKNSNGLADASDWGYWVNFNYGKWTDSYKWRNPAEGYNREIDNSFQSYSKGEKELYYLNTIVTRTHTALFEKDLRLDGKSSYANNFRTWTNGTPGPITYSNNSRMDDHSEGVLRLDKIYLLNNIDANLVSPSASTTLNSVPVNNENTGSGTTIIPIYNFGGHLGSNVIDKADVDLVRSTLITKSLKIIEFNYDYSLCPKTPNSFNNASPSTKLGKLTLTSIQTKAKSGAILLPPTKFNYELSDADKGIATLQIQVTDLTKKTGTILTANNLVVGDLLSFSINSNLYNAVVVDVNKIILTSTVGLSLTTYGTSVSKTKNPMYNKDAIDLWGNFKPDYDPTVPYLNENVKRMTTPGSAKCADVWSLRSISTPLGSIIKIAYESDSYSQAVLSGNASLLLSNFTLDAPNLRLTFAVTSATGYKLSSFFKPGDPVNLIAYRQRTYNQLNPCPPGIPTGTLPPTDYEIIGNGRRDQPPGDLLTIYSIDDANNKLTISYSPQYLIFGTYPQSGTCYSINFGTPLVGNLLSYNKREVYGGGLRVKSISVLNTSTNSEAMTLYDYSLPSNSLLSSGVTAYEPTVLDVPADNSIAYKKILYNDINSLLTVARECPPPYVSYEYVTVTNTIKNIDESQNYQIEGKKVYQFEVFSKNMLGVITSPVSRSGPINNMTIKNFCTRIGNLKRIISFDKLNRKINETVTNYLDDGLEQLPFDQFNTQYNSLLAGFNYQGKIVERFAQLKEVVNTAYVGSPNTYVMSAREEYPNIVTGQTSYDYITNTTTSSKNLAFDFYSGFVTKKLEIDGFGNRFMNEIVPAYRKYPEMGLKLNSTTQLGNTYSNKNMLSQTTANYLYKVDASNNKIGLLSADVQLWGTDIPVNLNMNDNTFSLQNGSLDATSSSNGFVWRKKAGFNWLPIVKQAGNFTPIAQFTDFNWPSPGSSVQNWKKTGEITKYNIYSKPIESFDMNGIFGSSKMGYNSTRVIASASSSKFAELAYSGAEDNVIAGKFNGNLSIGNGVVYNSASHTGYNSLKLSAGQTGFNYVVKADSLTAGRDYFLSVWVNSSGGGVPAGKLYYQVNSNTPVLSSSAVATKKAGNWYLLECRIPGSNITAGATITGGCKNNGTIDEYFDDFRFSPLQANLNSYVYDNVTGDLIAGLDNNNMFTKYEYDNIGRLKATYRETFAVTAGFVKLNEFEYNYGELVFKNPTMTQSFTKQCTAPSTGSVVAYTVPENTYYSTVSTADAIAQAQADINANGQAYANANGTCTAPEYIVTLRNFSTVSGASAIFKIGTTVYRVTSMPPAGQTTTTFTIPAGTYNIQFSGYSGTRSFTANGVSGSGTSTATLNNVVIGTSNNTITQN